MLFKSTVALASVLGALLPQSALAAPSEFDRRQSSLEDFIKAEEPIALAGLLANIGADGSQVSGAAAGIVVASPSKQDPDYFFTWTRDAALVFKAIVDRFITTKDTALERHIQEYISAQAKLQGVANPSGVFDDGSGLGEAKYLVDLGAFTDGWGRPQRDGPALRATAMIAYGQYLLANDRASQATDIVWPVVQNDLAYVNQYWNRTGFDLWEEVNGASFFTTAVQHRALVEGDAFAKAVGKACNGCAAIAPQVRCFLQTYWNSDGNYVVSNIFSNNGRAGKDANSILASIHTFDPRADCEDSTFQPCSPKALANLKAVVDSFRPYGINQGIAAGKAVAVGRYIEDVYFGGNPWYLTTLAPAEQLYDALYQWDRVGSISVTAVSAPFFRDLVADVAEGDYAKGSETYAALAAAARAYADGFVATVQKYAPAGGALAEQFGRDDGRPLSARDLTWSYASFLTAAARRAGAVPAPWGADAAADLPAVCAPTSVQGAYVSATNTAWGGGGQPTSTPGPSPTGCAPASVVRVTFSVRAVTAPGEQVVLAGSTPQLGNWSPAEAVRLSAADYTPANPVWKATVPLAQGLGFEFKFIRVAAGGGLTWERDPNRAYKVETGCAGTAEVEAEFQA